MEPAAGGTTTSVSPLCLLAGSPAWGGRDERASERRLRRRRLRQLQGKRVAGGSARSRTLAKQWHQRRPVCHSMRSEGSERMRAAILGFPQPDQVALSANLIWPSGATINQSGDPPLAGWPAGRAEAGEREPVCRVSIVPGKLASRPASSAARVIRADPISRPASALIVARRTKAPAERPA